MIFKAALLWATIAASTFQGASAAGCFQDGAPFHPDDWNYCQKITDTIFMYYTPLDDTVTLGMHVTEGSKGWTALATAGNGGMKGASQIVVRKEAGDWIAEDRYSMDYTTPTLDEQQDVQLLFAQQDEDVGETAWGVLIPQNSCDEQDYDIEDKTIFMLWAMGSSHNFGYHFDNRGQFMANLLAPPKELPSTEELDHIDFVMPNVPVVMGEGGNDPTNPYICTYFDMHELGRELNFTGDDKVHVTRFSPVLDENSEKYVHHMVVMGCQGDPSPQGGSTGYDGGVEHMQVIPECEAMPPGCGALKIAWAVGMEDIVLPDHVGLPIGEGQRYMVVQMHYFNPNLDEGVTDSSGIRAYVTTTDLRDEDAGVMQFAVALSVGQQPNIPGGMDDVSLESLYVPRDCTANAWASPLNVLGVFHHMHFLGKKMEISVERDGLNLGPVRKELHFDYQHQSVTDPVSSLKTLMPGDQIKTSCSFDTSSVTADFVEIGEESDKEMCYGTIFYYPRQERDTFVYFEPDFIAPFYMTDPQWCLSPPSNETFESLCAQTVFKNFTGFGNSVLTLLGAHDEGSPDYGMDYLCNGGDATAFARAIFAGFCPEACVATQSCTEEELIAYAHEACRSRCAGLGLSVYPDLSQTQIYDAVNTGCQDAMFPKPSFAAEPTCQVKGSLPQQIELQEVSQDGTTAAPIPATTAAPIPATTAAPSPTTTAAPSPASCLFVAGSAFPLIGAAVAFLLSVM